MARGIGYEHISVSTDTAILTSAGIYYGCMVHSFTTGPSKVLIYDASATNSGTLVGGAYSTGSAADQWQVMMADGGVACGSGIYANVTCTTGVDSVIIFYGPIS